MPPIRHRRDEAWRDALLFQELGQEFLAEEIFFASLRTSKAHEAALIKTAIDGLQRFQTEHGLLVRRCHLLREPFFSHDDR